VASQEDTTTPLCTNLCTNPSATHPHTATEATAASKTHAGAMEVKEEREDTTEDTPTKHPVFAEPRLPR